MNQEKLAELHEHIISELKETKNSRRQTERELNGLLAAAETVGAVNREAMEAKTSEWQAKLEEITTNQSRLEKCKNAVGSFLDHLGHSSAWDAEINRLIARHSREQDAAISAILKLEDKLSDARQRWFSGKCQRTEIADIKAAIAEQRAILEDLGKLDTPEMPEAEMQSAGISGLINLYRKQFKKYHDLLNQAGTAFEDLDIKKGLTDQMQTTLDLVNEALHEAGRTCGRSTTLRAGG